MSSKRNLSADHLRLLLIFLMVIGHLLELQDEYHLYRILYLFHMPCMLFLSGMYASPNLKRSLRTYLFPYVIFTITIQLWDHLTCGLGFEHISLIRPYWITWYLLLLFYYSLLLYPLQKIPRKYDMPVFLGTVLLYLTGGYFPWAGIPFAAGRFFSYLPWFTAGWLIRNRWTKIPEPDVLLHQWKVRILLLVPVVGSLFFLWKEPRITPLFLYGSVPYEECGGDPLLKLEILFFGACWMAFLYAWSPKRSIKHIDLLGSDTFSVYVCHAFAISVLERFNPFGTNRFLNLGLTLLLAMLMVCIFGYHRFAKPFRNLLTLNFRGK